MSMRDLALFAIVFAGVPFMLRRPFIGLLFWVWIGIMNPQQLAWGDAATFPFAMIVAVATLLGLLFGRTQLQFKGSGEFVILVLLFLWMSLTTLVAFNPALAFSLWERVAKIQLMVLVAFFVVNTKKQLDALLWVLALSIGYYGIKGGAFTLLTGGGHRVFGPGSSMVGDNNAIALAIIMTVPLLVYLRNQATNKWIRLGLLGAILLCAAAALGSQSRGAFLAVSAMTFFLWWKSRRKAMLGFALIFLVPLLLVFMPDTWTNRMQTIENYEADVSAMQRLNSWTTAINIANDRPLVGGGFNLTTIDTFLKYSPRPEWVLVAHSIYFQVLGEHGWVGLALYLSLWIAVWRRCTLLIKASRTRTEFAWAEMLGSMIQVSTIGYLVGGAFLSLAYWDMPYYLVVVAVVGHWIVQHGGATEKLTGNAWKSPAPKTQAVGKTSRAT
jgi:putative inorganic carbon (HCO3(-)) transporter